MSVPMDSENTSGSPSDDSITEQVIVALRQIIRAIDLRSRFLVTHHGLTGPQLVVLKELGRQGGVPVGRLARAVHLSQATVTGILVRLGKRGLVQRRKGEQDKRRVHVWLTLAGGEVLSVAPPLLQEDFTAEFSKLADWEQTQILSSLQRMVSMMEARHIDATPMLTTGPVDATTEGTKAFLGPVPNASADSEDIAAAADDSAHLPQADGDPPDRVG